jgi:hypothetical protein
MDPIEVGGGVHTIPYYTTPHHTIPYHTHLRISPFHTVLPCQPTEPNRKQTAPPGKGPRIGHGVLILLIKRKTKKVGSPLYYGQHGVQAKFLQHPRGEAAGELVDLVM